MATKVEALKKLYEELGGEDAGAAKASSIAKMIGYVADAAGDVVESIPGSGDIAKEIMYVEADLTTGEIDATAKSMFDAAAGGSLVVLKAESESSGAVTMAISVLASAQKDGTSYKFVFAIEGTPTEFACTGDDSHPAMQSDDSGDEPPAA